MDLFALSSNHLYGQEEEHADNNDGVQALGGFPTYFEVILAKYQMAVIPKNGTEF